MPQKSKPNLWMVIFVYYIVTSLGALLLGLIQPVLSISEIVIQLTQFGPVIGVMTILLLWPQGKKTIYTFDFRFWPHQPRKLIVVVALTIGIFAGAWLWYTLTGHSWRIRRPLPYRIRFGLS